MKKRFIVSFLIALLCVTGCGEKEDSEAEKIQISIEDESEKENLTEDKNDHMPQKSGFDFAELKDLEFYFSSGAGGWRTIMQIKADGSFSGQYSDSDMGATGEGYAKGTYYLCDFTGKFSEPVKVDDDTYSMKIEEIKCAKEADTSEIIDEIMYYYSTPYGLDGAEEILIYMPGTPAKELPEEYLNWVRNAMQDPEAEELPFYGLYNVTEQNGFSSYDMSKRMDDMLAATEEAAIAISASLEHDPLTQAEMNMKSMELYEVWDAALNTLWTELKETLSEDEFAELLDEQRAWIAEKEEAVKEAGQEVEGGSMYSLVVNMKAAEITEERVYELYEILK